MKHHPQNSIYRKEKKNKKNPNNEIQKPKPIEIKTKYENVNEKFERVEIPDEVLLLNQKFNSYSDKQWAQFLAMESNKNSTYNAEQKAFCDNFVKNIADTNTDDIVEYIMMKNDEVEEGHLSSIRKRLDNILSRKPFQEIYSDSIYFVKSMLLSEIYFMSASKSKKITEQQKMKIFEKIALDAQDYEVDSEEFKIRIHQLFFHMLKSNTFYHFGVRFLILNFKDDESKLNNIKEILYDFLKKGQSTPTGLSILREYYDFDAEILQPRILREILAGKFDRVLAA